MATFSGGYDYEFVDALPKSLECSICLLTLRDPHVTTCCGNHFCYSCINRINRSNKPCPLCNEPGFTTFLHKGVAREVNALKIYCPNKPQSCVWQGELGQVEKHLNPEDESRENGCGFVITECRYKCGNRYQRQQITRHEKEECPNRPLEVQMAHLLSTLKLLATETKAEIEALRQESNAKIDAIKQESKAEIEIVKQENATLREKSQATEAEVLALKAQLKKQLKIHSPTAPVPPFYYSIYDYTHYKKNDLSLFSPSFYSYPGGYKMRLKVFPGGYSSGHYTHLSIFVSVLRGEYDDNLQWPFKGDILIELYNYTSKQWDYQKWIKIRDAENGERSINRFGSPGFGVYQFIQNSLLQKSYVYNPGGIIRYRVKEVRVII